MTYYVPTTGHPRSYELADVLPPGMKLWAAFLAVTPYTVHAKPYGLDSKKPVEIMVYGVSKEELLFKYNVAAKLYEGYSPNAWHTCRFDQTTEGYRFVRSVVKTMKVLTSLAKKAAVERNKIERNWKAAKAREGREGTCQICEGRQIVQPTGENKGTLVLHGYRRPGDGYTVGNCYGYHRKPFEVACDALQEWVVMLTEEKTRVEGQLKTLATATEITCAARRRSGTQFVVYKVGEVGFERAIADRKYEYEMRLNSVTREVEYHTGRLANWKPA